MTDAPVTHSHPQGPRGDHLPNPGGGFATRSGEIYAAEGTAAFFTIRAYCGVPFRKNDALCARVIEWLGEMRHEYECRVGPYCLMPVHLPFVAGPLKIGTSVLTLVERIKGKTANESWRHGWSGKLWQRRQYDRVLRAADDLAGMGEYIANPARAGLVEFAEHWPWSGILDPQT